MRQRLAFIGILSATILISRPGVWYTIRDLTVATFDADTQKGGSYQTRWQLWEIAWQEIQRSPERTLFGYGPVSTEFMDLSHYFYGQEGWSSSIQKIGYTSWDNHYACDLIEFGVLGMAVELILFSNIAWILFKSWRTGRPDDQALQVGIALSCMTFMFAMTNVYIFAPQLKYLFWALVAVGTNWLRIRERDKYATAISGDDSSMDESETQPSAALAVNFADSTFKRAAVNWRSS